MLVPVRPRAVSFCVRTYAYELSFGEAQINDWAATCSFGAGADM